MDAKPEFLHLEVTELQDVMLVRLLAPSLDQLSLIMAVNDEISQLVEARGVRHIVLDMESVGMVSSVMLGKLISLQSRLKANGARLVLCCLHRQVREICAITKLNRIFEIQPDREQGLAALGIGPAS